MAAFDHLNLFAIVDRLLWESSPLHKIDNMGADVGQSLAVLRDIEEPGGPLQRYARHDFHGMMNASGAHTRVGSRAALQFAEDIGIISAPS